MLDSAFSWAILAVAWWILIGAFVIRLPRNPSTKITEHDSITKIYQYL